MPIVAAVVIHHTLSVVALELVAVAPLTRLDSYWGIGAGRPLYVQVDVLQVVRKIGVFEVTHGANVAIRLGHVVIGVPHADVALGAV